MRRLSLGALFHGTLLATGICLSCTAAAASASAGDPVPVCCGEGTVPDAQAQKDPGDVQWEGGRAAQDDRAYLLETASPGDTMTRQGPEIAIARLNPEFVAKLASAIREARLAGLPSAGIFSAYRPPVFGIGGFADKFKSLHAYGLAVDMTGIGDPGSKDAKLWHEIAARHGLFCPYGFVSRTEWNHCQATPLKSVVADNPLRKTITATGPVALEKMFEVGDAVIDDPAAAEESGSVRPKVVRVALVSASERLDRRLSHVARNGQRQVLARATPKAKSKMLVSAIDAKSLTKSHRKSVLDPKPHDARRAARTAESRREPARRRSRSA